MKSKTKMKLNEKYKSLPGKIHLLLKTTIEVWSFSIHSFIFNLCFFFSSLDADELIHSEINSNNPNDQSEDTDMQNSTPLFQRRTEPILPLKQPSPLTMLLQSNSIKQNPFAQYVKFDGTVSDLSLFSFCYFIFERVLLAESEFKSIKKIYCSFPISKTKTSNYRCFTCNCRRNYWIYLL